MLRENEEDEKKKKPATGGGGARGGDGGTLARRFCSRLANKPPPVDGSTAPGAHRLQAHRVRVLLFF